MTAVDALGYLASSLVLSTFCMQAMVALRTIAICSNVAFLAYGYLAGIEPVFVLHLILLPVNVVRLLQSRNGMRRAWWLRTARRVAQEPRPECGSGCTRAASCAICRDRAWRKRTPWQLPRIARSQLCPRIPARKSAASI